MSSFPILQKPYFGDACNRCGECCRKTPCPAAHGLMGVPMRTSCPALEHNPDGTTNCGLITNPTKHLSEMHRDVVMVMAKLVADKPIRTIAEAVGVLMGTGQGCDSVDRKDIDRDLRDTDSSEFRGIYEARLKMRSQPCQSR